MERLIKLLDQYKKIKIFYEQLDQIQFNMADPFILDVEWDEVHYEFLIRIKTNASNVLVFGSGAGGFQEQPIGPPIFHRHSWMGEFEDTVIYYNDPTLYLGEISLGWGQGTQDRFYLKDISMILMKILAKLHVDHKNVLFYGSSGGGFMSLILAGFVKGSTALVNNPQTILTKWIPVPVNQVFNLSYPGLLREDIEEKFGDRINVLEFYNSMKYIPNIYFLQNVACEFDVQNHLLPFISGLEKIDEDCDVNQIKIDLYYDEKAGHAAVGKNETIYYINQVKPSKNMGGVQGEMKLSVIIYLEEGRATLNRVLEKVSYLQPLEIIIVTNDKVETSEIIKEVAGCNIIILEEKDNNKARVTGAKAAKGDVFLFLHGNVVIFSIQLEQFLKPILNNETDVIVNNMDSSHFERMKMNWPDVSEVYRQVLNDVIKRTDLKIDSLLSMPNAITKKAIEDIGYETLMNPILAQINLIEKGWRISSSSSITMKSLDHDPSNKQTFYKNKLTQIEISDIENHLQVMSEWLQKKGTRGGYTDGGRKREIIEQLKKEKNFFLFQKGWGMHSSIYNGKQLSVIIPAQNEELTIEQVIREARKIEPKEIIVVINGSTDCTEMIAKQLGATVIVYKEALGHDVGRAIGALEATGDILLFIDADFSIPAKDLHPLTQAVADGTDIALNDLNLNLRFPLYIVNVYKYMLNIACNRRDLGVGSLVAVPHAISRKCLEGIGWDTLFTSCLAQVKAILQGYKVECVHYVDVMKPNRIRPSEHFASIGHPPAVLRITGDHLEGLSYLLKQSESKSFFPNIKVKTGEE
ncbi:glycosyl transferase [Bacillus cereus]|nr:glycosyl transferase [Bacillus cereus]PEQ26745.1 glycosyl transferase [Bacillus cereus]PER25784.1 glycosyl transferase [Bacillus cereus]PEX85701.1 glycosyl transferase [Bacillus cereus]PEY95993.1 glycosyl transferase [Bacillus cereus]